MTRFAYVVVPHFLFSVSGGTSPCSTTNDGVVRTLRKVGKTHRRNRVMTPRLLRLIITRLSGAV